MEKLLIYQRFSFPFIFCFVCLEGNIANSRNLQIVIAVKDCQSNLLLCTVTIREEEADYFCLDYQDITSATPYNMPCTTVVSRRHVTYKHDMFDREKTC